MLAKLGGFVPLDSGSLVALSDGSLPSLPLKDFPVLVLVLVLVGFDFLSPSTFLEVECLDLLPPSFSPSAALLFFLFLPRALAGVALLATFPPVPAVAASTEAVLGAAADPVPPSTRPAASFPAAAVSLLAFPEAPSLESRLLLPRFRRSNLGIIKQSFWFSSDFEHLETVDSASMR